LTVDKVEFIVAELLEELPGSTAGSLQVDAASAHLSGVRVLQSLIKFHSTSLKQMQEITKRVVRRTMDLVNDEFGNILLKTCLEHGTDDNRREVVNRLTNVHQIAKHSFGTHVVQAALDLCPCVVHPNIICSMRQTLNCHQNKLKSTSRGSYVFKALRNLDRREHAATGPAEGCSGLDQRNRADKIPWEAEANNGVQKLEHTQDDTTPGFVPIDSLVKMEALAQARDGAAPVRWGILGCATISEKVCVAIAEADDAVDRAAKKKPKLGWQMTAQKRMHEVLTRRF